MNLRTNNGRYDRRLVVVVVRHTGYRASRSHLPGTDDHHDDAIAPDDRWWRGDLEDATDCGTA
jgi:hypothetical protein